MDGPACPGCRERDARIAQLEQRVAALEARLGTNSSNSSLPPSANPPGAAPPVRKGRSKRRRGGQPGHPPHLKQLLPPERVSETHDFVPTHCASCQAPLPAQPTPDDPAPTRFQVVELPPVVVDVTEYRGHSRTCTECGHVTHTPVPRELTAHSIGPRLTATLSYFSGCHGVSKRGVEEIAEAVFDVSLSLGSVVNLEQEVSAALAVPHEEALAAVRAADVKNADETSWKLQGKLHWLWGAATATVAAFVIHGKRGAVGLTALLGLTIHGILCSDRWGPYDRVPASRRQVCWAHLKRDFQKIVDRGGPSGAVGVAGRRLVKKVFAAWHKFQAGQCTRPQLQAQLQPLENRLQKILLEGAILGKDPKVAAFCENLLTLEAALWTFARVDGVEPTNNHMERLLRRAVLWRKRSFGSASKAGCRFVERILTVVQTRRLQGRSVLDYLHDAVSAHRTGTVCPKLVPEG
jgi:transposase